MEIIFYLSIILSAIASVISIINNIHIFQLNYYRTDTQLSWLMKNKCLLVFNAFAFLLGIFSIKLWYSPIILLIVIFLFYIKKNYKKETKKPLVYTARVKRLLVTTFIIVLALYSLIFITSTLDVLVIACVFAFSSVIILIANLINQPIEKAVQRYYIDDAKKILKSHSSLIIIGITGSYGKTSMKYYLTTILNGKFNTLMTPESYNTPMGIVKTIRTELKPTHQIFVCEMGAKWVNDIKEICDIVHPHHGIITSIGEQHLESFGSLENIVKTKLELADALPENAVLLMNGNSDAIINNLPQRKYELYGTQQADKSDSFSYTAFDIKASRSGMSFSIKSEKEVAENLSAKLLGEHNAINLVGAVAMAMKMGMTIDEIRPQLRKIKGVPHRLQLLDKGDITFIDDAYNSNPNGCKAALDTLALFDDYKVLVTPGMVELGGMQDELNEQFGRQAAKVCDYVILVGEKQAVPIKKGLYEENFPAKQIFVASSIHSALSHINVIKTDKRKIVLLENDLPDNY